MKYQIGLLKVWQLSIQEDQKTYGKNMQINFYIRCKRRNVYITNMKQKMPQNADWYSFLQNNHNKTERISALVGYFKSEEIRRKFSHPIIITEEEIHDVCIQHKYKS